MDTSLNNVDPDEIDAQIQRGGGGGCVCVGGGGGWGVCVCGGGGGQGVHTPLKNHKNIGFLSNTGSDQNFQASIQAFNVGPSSAHQRNTI